MAQYTPWIVQKFYKADGVTPNAGGLVFTYEPETTTKKTTYKTSDGDVPNANPIVLDANGECSLLTDGSSLKVVNCPSTDTDPPTSPIKTYDNVDSSTSGDSGVVDNMVALRALSEGEFETVDLRGYRTVNDGGGGIFDWDATSTDIDNGGTIIRPDSLPSSGRYVRRVYGGKINVKWFGAYGDGSTDDTTYIQNTINYTRTIGDICYLPTDTYLVKNTINVYDDTQILGDYQCQPIAGGGITNLGSRINFTPTSLKTLFLFNQTNGVGTITNTSISGLYIEGDGGTYSDIGIETTDTVSTFLIRAKFNNLGITNFKTGINCNGTLTCYFESVYLSFNTVQNVFYSGNVETTDKWNKCEFTNSPIGVKMNGIVVGVVFDGCLFEALEDYGMDIDRSVQCISVTDCYCEDVPDGTGGGGMPADGAMFRVGHLTNGTTSTVIQLIVKGGVYQGHSTGTTSPSFIDVDYSNGIVLGDFGVSRYTTGISTNAPNTKANSIICHGFGGISVGTVVDDASILTGYYPNSGDMTQAGFNQLAKFQSLTTITDVNIGGAGSIVWSNGALFRVNTGTPVGVVSSNPGALWSASDGGENATLFIKETGSINDLAVSGITSVTTTATATTTSNHGIPTGETAYVVISGVDNEDDYNGTFLATSTGATTFTYTIVSVGGVTATGTILYNLGKDGWVNYRPTVPEFTGTNIGATGVNFGSLSSAITFSDGVDDFGGGAIIKFGSGSPEGAVTAPLGSIWMNGSGGTGTSMYVKETEVSTPDNVGWVSK